MMKLVSVSVFVALFSLPAFAQNYQDHDAGMLMNHGDGHLMDMAGGMVMGNNSEILPGGCDKIAETKEITVHAGHKYAEKFPGRMFAFDTQEFQFKPCTKLTVHFINDDSVRHQWMMHGLPKYLYPKGMFHLEVSGPAKISGTLILPPGDKTYLVHCDIAQHMEKGMKAQLKVGKGDGDLPSIPNVTANTVQDDYKITLPELLAKAHEEANLPEPVVEPVLAVKPTVVVEENSSFSGVTAIGLALGILVAPALARKFKGMTVTEIIAYLFDLNKKLIELSIETVQRLLKMIQK
ncbi:MAG: copper oxidase [Methylococcales bacterium]|nr:copper oxidase [Methylococcales bacterium]MDD5754088.1 copper oxidase [Methylococcales bacterium]